MNDRTPQKIIAVACTVGLVAIAYIGSYLPYQKSSGFISSMQLFGTVRSWDDLQAIMAAPLDAPSPIGQEELVRNSSNVIVNLVRAVGGPNKIDIIHRAMVFMGNYYGPILAKGRGLNFTQNLYVFSSLNEEAYVATNDPAYLAAAEKYLTEGLSLSPNRPQFLYGLFDVYRLEHNRAAAERTREKILELWPNDQQVRGIAL